MFLIYVRQLYLPVFCVLATAVYVTQHYPVSLPPLVKNYLNDLLCMPIVLKICQTVLRYIKSDGQLHIPLKVSLALTLLYALYFEFLLPQFNGRYTADPIDVFLYFLGLVFFIYVEDKDKDKYAIK